jgi:hypothetical protein
LINTVLIVIVGAWVINALLDCDNNNDWWR